ncbi:hypothetical protein Slin15195_G125070 [Septoria linicola]|uniref:Uncharacterized protein n=1 Tax=Septoria linicola TaxID=215465 RepID=A0A9Q9B872_9PEZI|nr:hypothetical protein Slin14017_G081260 [Septoria linicola]USW59188.1 hypothetical protein Slin15195_G125070 [Septoria linicola]
MSNLPERQQDAAIAGSFGSRPGAKDVTPAGVTSSHQDHETAPSVQSGSAATSSATDDIPSAQQVQGSVRSTADSAYQQLPSTRSLQNSAQSGAGAAAQQLPSSQGVLDTLSQGADYVARGVRNLTSGAAPAKVTADAQSVPQTRTIEQYHVPGSFVDSSSDQSPVDTLDELKANLPTTSSATRQGPVPGQKDNFQYTQEEFVGQPRTPVSGTSHAQAPPAERKEDLLPASGALKTLSEREQDNALAGSRPARPGVSSGEARQDVAPNSSSNLPVGVAGAFQSANPTLDNANEQVKTTVATAAQSAYNQLPSAQAVQQTAQGGAQYAAVSAKTGANAVYQQAPSAETMQGNAQYAAEAARSGANSAYQQAPSTQQVQGGTLAAATTVQSGLLKAEEQAYQAAQSVLGTVQSGLGYVKEAVAGREQALENDQIHKDGTNYIKEQLESKRTDTDKHTLLPVAGNSSVRPTHAGSASGIPRDTVESSAAPDVSYEHRPKTLPQNEIAGRDQERGISDTGFGAPARVDASRRAGNWAPEATASGEAVHEKSEVERELLRKVEPAPATTEARAPGGFDSAPSSGVAVVGNWGSETVQALGSTAASNLSHVPGQDPAYPHVGTAQVGQQPHQSESIPPVLLPKAGPEPGKGVAPIEDTTQDRAYSHPGKGVAPILGDDLESAKKDVLGSSAQDAGPTHQKYVQPPALDAIKVQDLGPSTSPATPASTSQAGGHSNSITPTNHLPLRPAEQSARAGSVNPVETNAGEGLSAPPVLPDSDIDHNTSSQPKGNIQQSNPNAGDTFDSPSRAGGTKSERIPLGADEKDPYWQGKESALEHLKHDTKAGVRENRDAIPVAGGKRVGEDHVGESRKIE